MAHNGSPQVIVGLVDAETADCSWETQRVVIYLRKKRCDRKTSQTSTVFKMTSFRLGQLSSGSSSKTARFHWQFEVTRKDGGLPRKGYDYSEMRHHHR